MPARRDHHVDRQIDRHDIGCSVVITDHDPQDAGPDLIQKNARMVY